LRARPGAAAGARGPRSRPPGRDAASRSHRGRRTRRELPRARTRRPHTSPDSPTTRPDRPLRSFAPSESPFTRCPLVVPGLAPRRAGTNTGPMLSWDSALLEPSPPRPRVRSIAREPGEPDFPGRPRPAPVVERGASILRPRPSGPDGCARLAGRSTPPADVAHVRAPSRRRPCLSCPCLRRPRRIAAAAARGFRGLKDMVVGRSR
jgi:hypothetical protein